MATSRHDIKHFNNLKLKVLQQIKQIPMGKALIPSVDANSIQAFSYQELKEPLGEMIDLDFLILAELEKDGFLEADFYDRLLLCPHCRAYNLCFRDTCPECQSSNIEVLQMIHHFRCGYVGPEDEFFSTDNTLICPKCSFKLISVGKDYEKPAEVFKCISCDWSGSESRTLGRCVVCDENCEPNDCLITDINSYRITPLGKMAAETGDLGKYIEEKEVDLLDSENHFSKINNLIALANELGRIAKRYNYTQIILCLAADALDNMNSDLKKNVQQDFLDTLTDKIRAFLRLTDYVTSDDQGFIFAVLPHTDIGGAEILVKRILVEIASSQFSGPISQTTLSIAVKELDSDLKAQGTFAKARELASTIHREGGNSYKISN